MDWKWIILVIILLYTEYRFFFLEEKIKDLEFQIATQQLNHTKEMLFINKECNNILKETNMMLEEMISRQK